MRQRAIPYFLLIFFITFDYSILSIGAQQNEECPTSCKCAPDPVQPSSKLVICEYSSNNQIHPIKLSYSNPKNIRTLFIYCDSPSPAKFLINAKFLKGLSSLHHLRIEGCTTTHFAETIFEDLTSLRKLELNRLTTSQTSFELSRDVLMPLSRLEKLAITSTPNLELPPRLLCSLPNLQVLNISSNDIPTLRREENCVAQQLLIVDVSANRLVSIEQFLRGAPAVRQISVARNAIEKLEFAMTQSVPFLQQLDAEANMIDSIENSLPETLVHLNLASNRLSSIPDSIYRLPHLVALNISSNLVQSSNSSAFVSSELESLDVSNNQLDSLPAEWLENCENTIAHLRMSSNRITELIVLTNASNLQTLDLSSNRIRVFTDALLPRQSKLTNLRLSNNSLEVIEPKAFDGLKLDQLDLSHNLLTEIPSALGSVEYAKRIDLSHNQISKLYQYIINQIKQLHTVDLSNNLIQSIGPYIFSDSSDIHTLDLSGNEISLMFKDAFARCPKLRKLVLRDNKINSLDEGLVEASSLRKLDISQNAIVVLKWDSLPNSLEYLNADENQINLLTASGSRSSLKTVSLSKNRLSMLTGEQIPNSVEMLDVSHNRIAHFAKGTLAQKTQLRRLNLVSNMIDVIGVEAIRVVEAVHPIKMLLEGNPLECSCEMTWMLNGGDDKKNQVRVIIEDRQKAMCKHAMDDRKISIDRITKKDMLCQYSQVCEPECICCQYGNCDCKSVCPASCRCFRDDQFDINVVRCERNETIEPRREFVVSELPVSATEIYLSGVDLPQLRTHSFIGRMRLERLHINGTGLRSIQAKSFHTLPSLKTLDLSDNALLSLNGDEFLKTPELAQLFLNGNRFSTLTRGVFDRLPNLKFLTLHNNSFEDIPQVLSSTGSLSGISLSSNPFRCDCAAHAIKFEVKSDRFSPPRIEHNAAEWMSLHRHLVVDASKVECVENVTRAFITNDTTVLSAYPPNVKHDIFVMPIDEFLRDYNVSICVPFSSGFFGQDPQNSIIFVALAVAASILMCIFVIMGISFIRRSHDAINQRRYKASSLNCSTSAGSSPLPIPLLSYHAFVSYSKKDEKMVIDQLCRPLEDEDYQLCLLHRDGPTYNSNLHAISDELIAQMDSSQCLILVLTKHFLDNEWKTLQIKTSHQLFAKNRAKRVIAVLGDGVDANLLDDELGQILRKHTRIEMKSHLFWTLLHSSLPSRLPIHANGGSSNDDSSQVYSDIYGIVPSDVV